MTFENFMHNLGLLIKESRKARNLTLYQLAYESDIVADHIQKIESSKHGGIQVITYAKLLSGLDIGLSFRKNDKKNDRLIPVTTPQQNFINTLFFNLTIDPDLQFLNYNPVLLLLKIGELVRKKRMQRGLTQKQLAEKAHISNTTVSRVECGKYNFSLLTLYKLSQALHIDKNKGK